MTRALVARACARVCAGACVLSSAATASAIQLPTGFMDDGAGSIHVRIEDGSARWWAGDSVGDVLMTSFVQLGGARTRYTLARWRSNAALLVNCQPDARAQWPGPQAFDTLAHVNAGFPPGYLDELRIQGVARPSPHVAPGHAGAAPPSSSGLAATWTFGRLPHGGADTEANTGSNTRTRSQPRNPSAQEDTPDPGQDALRTHFREWIPELLREHRVPGLAIAVVRDGAIAWAEGFGVADAVGGRAVTPETVFNAGSVSKAVTAWGVMGLVEAGSLELDGPVGAALSSWPLPKSEFDVGRVTVRRLLSHTAGLSMHSIPGFQLPAALPALEAILAGDYEGSMYTPGGTPVVLVSPPGSEWRYSGGGYVLLELLVEEVSLRPFDEFMQRRVLEPLGMRSSHFGWRDELAPRAAVPYRADGTPYPTYRFTGVAGAGLYTTITDLGRFAAALLPLPGEAGSPPGRGVLEPDTVTRMLEHVRLDDGSAARCGLGYFLGPPGAELRQAHHSGSNNGWRAQIICLPDRGRALAVLANSDNAGLFLSDLVCAWSRIEVAEQLPDCR